ncbi:MAG: hypothetical protein HY918_05160 [Candidatus Doudnabacteria bacterium]|nr:hypothetical protein [Candidatus Doudnabacteria bacterium]
MDTKEDVRLLVKDLFTHTEYKMLSKRLEIGRLLLDGESYDKIKQALQVTATTISRISNMLSEKGEGVRKAHLKLNLIEEKRLARQKAYSDNLSNPFKLKSHRKSIAGALIKSGIKIIDKKISRSIKTSSAKKSLEI